MAAIYKTLISTSLEGTAKRVQRGLANVPGPTAIAVNDVKEVKRLIRDLKSDEELLRTSLETSRGTIKEWQR